MKLAELHANREPSMTPVDRLTRERNELLGLNALQAQRIARMNAEIQRLQAELKAAA